MDNRVEAPEQYKLLKFVLLFINNVELFDNEFKLLNIVVDVAFKLLMDNIELVDNEFKLLNIVVDVAFKLLIFEFIPNTDKPDVFISLIKFKVDFIAVAPTIKGLLTANKELDNVIYEFPEI